jgi:hypothetical protein
VVHSRSVKHRTLPGVPLVQPHGCMQAAHGPVQRCGAINCLCSAPLVCQHGLLAGGLPAQLHRHWKRCCMSKPRMRFWEDFPQKTSRQTWPDRHRPWACVVVPVTSTRSVLVQLGMLHPHSFHWRGHEVTICMHGVCQQSAHVLYEPAAHVEYGCCRPTRGVLCTHTHTCVQWSLCGRTAPQPPVARLGTRRWRPLACRCSMCTALGRQVQCTRALYS